MARKTKAELTNDKLTYMRVQMERFIFKHYKLRPNIEVFMQKKLIKNKRKHSETYFPDNIKDKDAIIEVDFDYDFVRKRGRKFLLPIAFREGVRIGMRLHNRPFINGQPEFESELRRFNLPAFGSVSEVGLDLHTYSCSKCERVWIMKEKKLRKRQDPVEQNYRTSCCGTPFKYDGVIHYKNNVLQQIYFKKKYKNQR